jgi:Rne/Rng family ribonuclease
MSKELVVSATGLETKLAILEDDQVTELFIERERSKSILGNIYKGRVTRVLPGMQAAFVDIGLDRNAFLYVADFFEDYENYEELFKATNSTMDELLMERPASEAKPSARRSRRGRRGAPQRPSDDVSAPRERAADKPASASQPAGVPPPPPPRAEPPWILVDELDFQGSAGADPAAGSREYLECPEILPDRLTPSVKPGGRRASRGSSRRGQARLEAEPEVRHFSTPQRNSNRGRRKNGNSNGPLIGDLLKEGQEILVQVAKEPIGRKGARITSYIVFPGRFLVFMPTVDHVGVSRRIESARERQRLRDLVLELRGEIGRGFIVRTAGEGTSREELRQDMIYLTRLWEQIKGKADRVSAPALLHSELDLVQRVIRDFFSDDYRAIRVDDEEEYERIVEFISNVNPDYVGKVRLHNRSTPIFDEFGVNGEIEKALKSKIWLKSGGYIVINQTEALVAIDVNTGKYVGKTSSLEDTIAKTNLDAVREVVRQVRLRDLGGIIIVDFIDMDESKNQQRVMETLQEELRKDKSPSKVLPFNEFGLVAITRKRVKQSLERTLCQSCITCDGTGMTKSVRTICYSIHEEVRRVFPTLGAGRELIVRCHPDVGQALQGAESRVRRELCEITGKEVTIMADPLMHIERFDLVEA